MGEISSVIHKSPLPDGGYSDRAPVSVEFSDGRLGHTVWGDYAVLAWRAEHGDNAAIPYQAPPLTEADFQNAIDAHIEATAKARQYSSAVSCASYAASNNPAWQAEALAFIAWRDAVWAYAFTELAKVQNEEREPPASIAAFIAELPDMTWPS